jgi:hypothetical protein
MRFRYSTLIVIATAASILGSVLGSMHSNVQAQTNMQFPTTGWGGYAPAQIQCGLLKSADMNVTTDQAIQITFPTVNYEISRITASNASVSLTTAAGGIYQSPSKAGTAIVSSAQAYSTLTAAAVNAAGSALDLTLNAPTALFNVRTIYLSLTTAQGAASTADFRVYCVPSYG